MLFTHPVTKDGQHFYRNSYLSFLSSQQFLFSQTSSLVSLCGDTQKLYHLILWTYMLKNIDNGDYIFEGQCAPVPTERPIYFYSPQSPCLFRRHISVKMKVNIYKSTFQLKVWRTSFHKRFELGTCNLSVQTKKKKHRVHALWVVVVAIGFRLNVTQAFMKSKRNLVDNAAPECNQFALPSRTLSFLASHAVVFRRAVLPSSPQRVIRLP